MTARKRVAISELEMPAEAPSAPAIADIPQKPAPRARAKAKPKAAEDAETAPEDEPPEVPGTALAKPKLRVAEVADALKRSAGIVTVAAKHLGRTPRELTKFILEHDSLKEIRSDLDEQLVDLAEGKMVQMVHAGNFQAVRFVLITKGKKRGWVEKAPDGPSVQANVQVIFEKGDEKL